MRASGLWGMKECGEGHGSGAMLGSCWESQGVKGGMQGVALGIHACALVTLINSRVLGRVTHGATPTPLMRLGSGRQHRGRRWQGSTGLMRHDTPWKSSRGHRILVLMPVLCLTLTATWC